MIKIPVLRPLLPTVDKIIPYLEQIDENRYYSNLGPITKAFEARLEKYFDASNGTLVTSANGTLALTQILKAFGVAEGELCVMPSWTFIATPAAAVHAGLIPYFIDVDNTSWTIQPRDILELMKSQKIGAVIVVSPFGAPVDMDVWNKFSGDTNIPVVIDAAAGFDSLRAEILQQKIDVPVMISFHATKVFGVGEGAAVLTNDKELAKKIRMFGNFGFYDQREGLLAGTNAKMNEYMSAIGLASLDQWPETRARWQVITDLFQKQVANCPDLSLAPQFNQGWISSYGIVKIASGYDVGKIKKILTEEGIGNVCWWGEGCHRHTAYRHFPKSSLPVTEDIAAKFIGLPFWLDLTQKDFDYIFFSLKKAMDISRI